MVISGTTFPPGVVELHARAYGRGTTILTGHPASPPPKSGEGDASEGERRVRPKRALRGPAAPLGGRRSAVAQEGRDVDVVVGDLQRRALALADARAAVAPAGAVAGLLAGGARAGATVVEARGDDGDAHLVAELVVDDRAEDDVGGRVGRALDDLGGLVDLEEA